MELLEIQEQNIDFLGDNVCYDKKNEGDKALLFIHGHNSSKKFWRHQVERLWLDNYKILAVDLLGYGQSDKSEFPYSFRLWAEIIEMLRIIEGIDQLVLVAHSNGALVAREYYRRYPENVEKMVMLEGYLKNIIPEDKMDWMQAATCREDYRDFIETMIRQIPMNDLSAEDREMIIHDTVNTPAHVNYLLLDALQEDDLWQTDLIHVPVLMINAKPAKIDEYEPFLAGFIPQLIYQEWDNCGHMLPLERPQQVTDSILNFI